MTIDELREADYLYNIITQSYKPLLDHIDLVLANGEVTAITIGVDGITTNLYDVSPDNMRYARALIQSFADQGQARLNQLGVIYPEPVTPDPTPAPSDPTTDPSS